MERREKFQIGAIALLILIGVFLEIVSLGLFIPAISLLTSEGTISRIRDLMPFASGANDGRIVVVALMLVVCVFLVKNMFAIGAQWYQRTVVARISTRLSQGLFDRYLHQDYQFHVQNNSSVLIRNMQNAAMLVSSGIDPLISLATDGLIAIGIIVLLLVVDPVPAIVVMLLYGTVGFGLHRLLGVRVKRLGVRRNEHNALTLKHQQQGLAAIKTLIITGRREVFSVEHHRHVSANNLINRSYGLIQQIPRLWIEMLTVISLSVLVAIVVLQGRSVSDSLPILGLFAVAAFRVQPSINRIILSLQSLSFASAAVSTVEADYANTRRVEERDVSTTLDFRSLILERVSFRYPSSSEAVLDGVEVKINRGERVGVSGRSGAGKTTLVDLMIGLLTPSDGSVRVNDVDIGDDPTSWQRSIGFVPQDVYLIDDSILRNVAFGLPMSDAVRAQVAMALDGAQLGDFVRCLPEGMETVVGERGMRLSGGQRQRIGIARALMGDPQVMVFDEATSSLDSETEREVLEAIDAVVGDRTMIVIAHRVSTLAKCDRILRVEDGSVVDLGLPTVELLQRLAGGSSDEA